MTTSGVVTGNTVTIRQILDHAFRRAGKSPQRVGSEALTIARELLDGLLSEYCAVGFPLWTRTYSILSVRQGDALVSTPVGTVDVQSAFWRTLMTYRGACILTNNAGNTSLFSGQASSDVSVPGPNPSVTVNFGAATEVDTIGILPGAGGSYTTGLTVLTSPDGTTYTEAQTIPETTYVAGTWAYYDLNPVVTAQYVRVRLTSSDPWVLNQMNFGLANGYEIPLGPLSQDDYYNLPNKTFPSNQPNSYFDGRTAAGPVLNIWPVPNEGAFYNGTVTALMRRYTQDAGDLTNTLEVPRYWIEAVQWRLAVRILDEMPDDIIPGMASMTETAAMRGQRYERVVKNAEKAEAIAWGEERTRAPIRIAPNIRSYTV